MAELTPMMQQYRQIKAQNTDCILFFRLGDFYEMFDEDAQLASKELDLTLTTRDRSKAKADEDRTPMCGVPYHSSEGYIARLVAKGYKVAICEQMEDPALTKGLVKRDIIRIVTPGTVTQSSMLDETKNNYYCCLYEEGGVWALCFCDISTGACSATRITGESAPQLVCNELSAFHPAEALLGGGAGENAEVLELLRERLGCCITAPQPDSFDEDFAAIAVRAQFPDDALPDAVKNDPVLLRAVGALLRVLKMTQRCDLGHIRTLEFYMSGKFMTLDLTARRNLELTQTLRSKDKKGSLLWVLDKTKTAMGGRLLRQWMERPLLSPAQIQKRLGAVEELVTNTVCREELIFALRSVTDMERVTARVATGTANCRDLLSLALGAQALPEIKSRLASLHAPLLQTLCAEFDTLEDITARILSTVTDDPPFTVRDGGLIREGADAEIDRLRSIQSGGKQMLLDIETREKEQTGIRNLRVGYNRVFGYYIEVARGQVSLVPDRYIRKQTLSTGERYITEELKELENTILTAKDRLAAREYELFVALRDELAQKTSRVQAAAQTVATLDVLCSFAAVAVSNHYCKPEIDLSGEISITQGRHPVVEQVLKGALFVPNDTQLGSPDCRAAIITGPNMAGKSTYMRQVALIVLMAQMGCFVPAKSARIGVVDRLFTRIGASDDLAAGQSTFMVEMNEVADILKNATPHSLLILDEIGRGTSTFDGMAIARAVLEHVADAKKLGAKTLFATHYHELTALEDELSGVKNYNIAVKKRAGGMIFLRKIVPGAADDSYGVEVAKLAGLPDALIARARQLLKQLESGAPAAPARKASAVESDQVSMLDLRADELRRALEAVTIDTLTPIEAMNVLYKLKTML